MAQFLGIFELRLISAWQYRPDAVQNGSSPPPLLTKDGSGHVGSDQQILDLL